MNERFKSNRLSRDEIYGERGTSSRFPHELGERKRVVKNTKIPPPPLLCLENYHSPSRKDQSSRHLVSPPTQHNRKLYIFLPPPPPLFPDITTQDFDEMPLLLDRQHAVRKNKKKWNHTRRRLFPQNVAKKSLGLRILVIRLGKARQVGVFETRKLCWDPLTDCAQKLVVCPIIVSLFSFSFLASIACSLLFYVECPFQFLSFRCNKRRKKDLRIGSPEIHPANKNIHHLLLWGLPLILFGGVGNGGGKTDNDPFLVGRTQIYPHFIPKNWRNKISRHCLQGNIFFF